MIMKRDITISRIKEKIFLLIILSREKISIIIPSYNREKLIIRSINSILNQTYQNIEVILIDDGSTDNTKKVISQIKDKRFRYIKLRKNKGANVARNIGIQKAIGNYIAFQDSDDFFHSDKLEKQINISFLQ
jgi:glycosyltransferase involved in cell wall biosynthesis